MSNTLVGGIPGGNDSIREKIASMEGGRVSKGRTVVTVVGIGLLGLSASIYAVLYSGDCAEGPARGVDLASAPTAPFGNIGYIFVARPSRSEEVSVSRRIIAAVLFLTFTGAAPVPAQGDSMGPTLAPSVVRWPLPVSFDVSPLFELPRPCVACALPMPAPPPVSQVVRRPVYNDTGEVIPYSVIVERTDPSGAKGAVIGSLVGFLVGGAVGWEVGNSVDCGTGSGLFGTYDLCSPREEALRRAWRGIGMVTGTFFGAWIGHEGDQVTWLEAIRKIRGRGIAP